MDRVALSMPAWATLSSVERLASSEDRVATPNARRSTLDVAKLPGCWREQHRLRGGA